MAGLAWRALADHCIRSNALHSKFEQWTVAVVAAMLGFPLQLRSHCHLQQLRERNGQQDLLGAVTDTDSQMALMGIYIFDVRWPMGATKAAWGLESAVTGTRR